MPQHLQSQGAVLTGARQTMSGWSRVIESREAIPTVYRQYFDETFESVQTFPRVVLTPALNKFPRRTTEKLVIDTADAIHILERSRNQIDASCYRYGDVYAVELGMVLLESWLTIRGKTNCGESGVSKIDFNTTSMRHFDALLRKMRPLPSLVDPAQFAAERDKFDCLSDASFKFMNYGRQSLVPGERVLGFVLQPEIRQPFWTAFGRTFYRTIELTHLSIITDQELILIRNADRSIETQVDRYGGVWQYIPLHRLESVKLTKASNERYLLSIRCQPGTTVERLFEASRQAELEQFCSELQVMIERIRAAM